MLSCLLSITPARATLTDVADPTRFSVRGDFRFRQEYYNHTDFVTERSASLLRLRPRLTWTPTPEIAVLLQPQAAKAFGEPAFVPNATTGNRAADSSGMANSDTSAVTFHQAYADYRPLADVTLRLGRQVLTYGDELVLGALDWANVARSFDAVRVLTKHRYGATDVFTAKLKDTNVVGAGPGDKDLHGLYTSFEFGAWLNQFDLYLMDLHDASTRLAPATLVAVGARAKSVVGPIDYRAEFTRERGFATPDGFQYNPEVGYTLPWADHHPRLGVEYYYATGDYNQLYPSAHRWLGIADVLGRRNVKGVGAHLATAVTSVVDAKLDYHHFERVESARTVFRIDGHTEVGRADGSTAMDLGDEVDLIVKWRAAPGAAWTLGYAKFWSGAFFNDQFAKKNPDFAYLSLEAEF